MVELRNAIQYGLYKIQVSAKTKREGCQETTVARNRENSQRRDARDTLRVAGRIRASERNVMHIGLS